MASPLHLFIGSYTDGRPYFVTAKGCGISSAEFDPATGKIAAPRCVAPIDNPSYLALDGGMCYAVSERFSAPGDVHAFANRGDALDCAWSSSSHGRATCHLTSLHGGRGIAAVSYSDGLLTVLDAQNGELLQRILYTGRGPHATRQEASHPHQAVVSPAGGWLLVPDLGADCVWSHRLAGRAIDPAPIRSPAPAGTGPRHLVFHHDEKTVSLLGELDGKVHTGRWDEISGVIEWLHSLPVVPGAPPAAASASAIRLHPRLPVIYAANRSSHEIAVLTISKNVVLTETARIRVAGRTPRDFALSPCGRWLVAACQDSNLLASYLLEEVTGKPASAPASACEIGTPVCVLFSFQK